MISDVFSTSGQFDWMLVTFLEQLNISSHDDVITYSALIYGLLKSSAVGRIVSVLTPITSLTIFMYVHMCMCHFICLDMIHVYKTCVHHSKMQYNGAYHNAIQ